MNSTIYTNSELTDAKYTIAQAVASAKSRLKKHGLLQVCTNAISGLPNDHRITLAQLNDYADAMVDDTLFYDGSW